MNARRANDPWAGARATDERARCYRGKTRACVPDRSRRYRRQQGGSLTGTVVFDVATLPSKEHGRIF
jgi:hypothetical protein